MKVSLLTQISLAKIQTYLEASEIPPQHVELWNIVKAAQESALSAAIAGTKGEDVDKAARNIIRRNGYGRYFTHRLGHGRWKKPSYELNSPRVS